ncbi:MAG: hypothetical protein ACLFSQ_00930 [Candidatus Zixiibacteriota bacterium]
MALGLFARVNDIPHFGLERIVFPETTDYGMMEIEAGYSPLYMDPDSTLVTIYGNMQMDFLRWLSFHTYFPYYSEVRGALVKAGPGDAVLGLTARGEIPYIYGLHVGIFGQATVPSGYRGHHSAFPDYTSGSNDFGYGAALGYVQENAIHIAANFAASMPEDMSDIYYRAGGGLKVYLPWQMEIKATYITDFTANPPHDFHFNVSKDYKFVKLNAGFSKDFARHEESFGYNVGLATRIRVFEDTPDYLPGVEFIDRTSWQEFPQEDTLWNNLMNLTPKYKSLIDEKITIEYSLLDFTNEKKAKSYLPLILRKENILGRYTMSFKAKDTEGKLVADKNIYGLETKNGEFLLLGEDSNDYTQYCDFTETQKLKKEALKELFENLHHETKRIRKGQY